MAFSGTGDFGLSYGPGGSIFAGATADGTLTISSGSYSTAYFASGASQDGFTATVGTITLTGIGTSVSVEDSLSYSAPAEIHVGSQNPFGAGYLEILDGAQLTLQDDSGGGYINLRLGAGENSFGRMTVDGVGSRFLATGLNTVLRIGSDGGTGELFVSAGGSVGARQAQVGYGTGSNGSITVDGSGSALHLGSSAGASGNAAGSLFLGRDGGRGYLTISGGGSVTVDNVDGQSGGPFVGLGFYAASYGSLVVDGEGSLLHVQQHGPASFGNPVLTIGHGGEAAARVRNGGSVQVTGENAFLAVGAASGPATDVLEITGGASVVVDSQLYQGSRIAIGGQEGASGRVVVDGAGSLLSIRADVDLPDDFGTGLILVGQTGTGVLDVSNGGAVGARGITVGAYTGASSSGNGTINITGGGTVTIAGGDYTPGRWGLVLATQAGTQGTVNVDGAGSTVTSQRDPNLGGSASIVVGDRGTAALNITNGGLVQGHDVQIGFYEGAVGTASIDGAGSLLLASGVFGSFMGYTGPVFHGGQLSIGSQANSTGSLSITNGGRAEVTNGYGTNAGGAAVHVGVVFQGTSNAHLVIDGRVSDGQGGYTHSALDIVQHGALGPGYGSNPRLVLGSGAIEVRNHAQLNILGAGAAFGDADTGGIPTTGELRITGGGSVLVDSQSYSGAASLPNHGGGYGYRDIGASMVIGANASATVTVLVDGAGSTLTVRADTHSAGDYTTGQLIVGGNGTGSLEVVNGGAVEAREIELGVGGGQGSLAVGSGGTVTVLTHGSSPFRGVVAGANGGSASISVTGAGSALDVQGDGYSTAQIVIGDHGTGVLQVSDGAGVEGGDLIVGQGYGGNGTVDISTGGTVTVTGNDTGHRAGLTIGAGPGSVGVVTVGGAGSTLTAQRDPAHGSAGIYVGSGGQGAMYVQGGALAQTFNVAIAEGYYSSGTIVVDGAGSRLLASNDFGAGSYGGSGGGHLRLGADNGAHGALMILNGGRVDVQNDAASALDGASIHVGLANGGYGHIAIEGTEGAVSSLNLVQHGAQDGQGQPRLSLILGNGFVGVGHQGQLNITGAGATLDSAYGLPGSVGRLMITDGGDVLVDSQGYAGYAELSDGAGGYFQERLGASMSVGQWAGSYTRVQVAGAGSTLTVRSDAEVVGDYVTGWLGVGGEGTGRIDVSQGAALEARTLAVGHLYGGSGTLTVESGGTVTLVGSDGAPYQGLRIGMNGIGAVTVDGAGSRLVTQGGANRVQAGANGGVGTLNVTNGGYVGTLAMKIGRQGGGTGNVNIDGSGSLVRLSTDFGRYTHPTYAGQAGIADFGREDGNGFLRITNGGGLLVENADGETDASLLRLGRDNGSYGYALVSGAGSSLDVVQHGPSGDSYGSGASALIGDGGQGVLKVQDGAALRITGDRAFLSIADGRFNQYGPNNTGDESLLEITGGGTVVVDSGDYGGTTNTGEPFTRGAQAFVARGSGTNGRIVVDGLGSKLTVRSDDQSGNVLGVGDYATGQLVVAGSGTGVLEVRNQGAVQVRELEAGTGFGGYGTVAVATGGVITVIGTRETGYQGIRVGANGGTGRLTIDGPGSVVTSTGYKTEGQPIESTGRFLVGDRGTGHVEITNGGAAQGFDVMIGRNDGGRGYLTVDGYGSTFTSSDAFGLFNPDNYGPQGGTLRVGRDGAYGRVEVINGGALTVESDPNGVADLSGVQVGRGTGGHGVVVVDGSDGAGHASTLNVLVHGPSNDGYLPGTYYGPRLQIGRVGTGAFTAGGQGEVTVRNGAALNVLGEAAWIAVGHSSSSGDPLATPQSRLTIESGGVATVDSRAQVEGQAYHAAALVSVGHHAGGNGLLTVSGIGSQLRIYSDNGTDFDTNGYLKLGAGLQVGREGRGELLVENGGAVVIDGGAGAFPHFAVGRGLGADGAVGVALVTGAGSRIDLFGSSAGAGNGFDVGAAGSISVGTRSGATGELTISAGGVVANNGANTKTQVAQEAGSAGALTVTGDGSRLEAGAILTVGADIDLATGELLAGGGGDGTLTILDSAIVTAGVTLIGDTGKLNVSGGTLVTDVTVTGSFFAGGDEAVGSAFILGDFEQQAGIAEVEIGGIATGEFDIVEIDGDAVFAASTLVVDLGGLGAVSVGDTVTFLTVSGSLSLDESLIGVIDAPTDVSASFFRSTVNGEETVSLIFTGTPGGSVGVVGFEQVRTEGNPGGDVTFVYTLERTNTTDDLTVDFAVTGRGANPVNGADFEGGILPTGTVAFLAGQSRSTVTLRVAEDFDIESDEGLLLTISNPVSTGSDPVVVSNASVTGVLRNDDLPASISINALANALEGEPGETSTVTFTVTRTGNLAGDVAVSFIVNAQGDGGNEDLLADPDDFVAGLPTVGQVVFLDGQSTAQIDVQIVGDDIIEPREKFSVTLTGFSGPQNAYVFGNQTAQGEIVNDDGQPPVLPTGLSANMFGDPHIVTLDGLGYDFQAVGEFTLAQSTDGALPLDVQVRTAPLPGSDLVSIITAMATDMGGGATLMIDVEREPALLVDGVAAVVQPTGADPVTVGDGQVFFDGDTYTIVYGSGEAVTVDVFDGFINVQVYLSQDRDPGTLTGLLGNADGDVGNDFRLRDGSNIPDDAITVTDGVPALDFEFLYGTFADSWRITDAGSFFHYSGTAGDAGTADHTDTSFPRGVLSTAALPEELLQAAIAAVDAAGITDPALREAAILDFALTGDDQFAAGASGVTAPTSETTPTAAPVLPTTVGVTAPVAKIFEGDSGATSVSVTFYRIGDATNPLQVGYTVAGTADAADLAGSPALSGTVSFGASQSSATISFDVAGDLAAEADEVLRIVLSAPSTVLVGSPFAQVTIVNDDNPPVAQNDPASGVMEAGENGTLQIAAATLLANDLDPDGDTIAIQSVQSTSTGGASVSLSGGNVVYDPRAAFDHLGVGQSTTDTFEYTISDGTGGTDTAIVTVTVTGVNDAPVALDDGAGGAFSTGEGTALQITVAALTANDSDPENDAFSVTSVQGTTAGGASVSLSGGTVTYDASGAFDHLGTGEVANDSFTYTVTDAHGATDTATVTVVVNGVNDAPNAQDDAGADFTTSAGTSFVTGNVLANDEDAEDDTLQVIGIGTAGTLGSVANNGDGTFDYDPGNAFAHLLAGQSATDSFTYTVTDGALTDTATVIVTIRGSESLPLIEGTDGNDTLVGSAESERLDAKAGDDVIIANAGDDMLEGGEGRDQLEGGDGRDQLFGGAGDDTLEGGAGADSLDGGAGIDTLSYAGSSAAIAISLQTGYARGGDAQGDRFSGFEAAIGSAQADAITGSFRDETIEGRAGGDTLQGAGGIDTLSYAGSAAGIALSLQTGHARGGDAQGDRFSGFEAAIGSAHADAITGSFRDETIEGGGGGDALQGAGGFDTLSYAGSAAGIAISLQTGHARGGDAQGDRFSGFEAAIGSAHADAITGSFRNETIEGGAGGDALQAAGGFDTLSYAGSAAGIAISLQTGHARGGDAQGDRFSGFEGAIGSAHADAITGSFRNETLEGGADDDRIQGAGGRDTIDGGAGDDVLSGGSAADTFEFTGIFGQDRITDFEDDLDRIVIRDAGTLTSSADAGADAVYTFVSGAVLIVENHSVAALADDITFA